MGYQGLLNIPGDVEFLLETLPLALAFDQARVVKNAGRFHRESVQNLPVKFGKSRIPAGIQVHNTEKMTMLGGTSGIFRAGAKHGVQGNGDDGAQGLRNDALRNLKFQISPLEVFGDDAGFLLEGLAQGRLARRQAFRLQTHPAAASGAPNTERSRRISP